LAAHTTPPQPTATTTAAAIRRRQAGAKLDLREKDFSTAIGGAMKLAF
jgi:hypothetical protein